MAEVSIGDAIGAGFQLIRRQPLVVMTWGLAGLLTGVMAWSVFGSFYVGLVSEFMRSGGTVNPMTSPDMMQRARSVQGASFLVSLVGVFVDCVVYCAVFRSVIHPGQGRFAYLRIGAPELFALVLVVAGYIALVIALIVPMVIIGALVAAFVAAHAAGVGIVIGILGGIALFVGLAYVLLRLSLIVPMMVSDGKFHFADAWTLTRRHAGALLVIGIALFAILLIAEIVFGLVLLAVGFGYLSSVAGGLSHLRDFFSGSPASILASVAPLLLIFAVIWIPLTGCAFAVIGAPWARAYRDLSGPDLAATFS
jgi:hypothetical protein